METSTDQSEGTPGFESENFLRTEGSLRNHFTTLISDATAPIFRLVLTGGPCAGKTTAMTIIEERMRTRGFRTFIVPEAASLLISGGFMFGDISTDERRKGFQACLLKTQLSLEETFYNLAKVCGQPSLLVCDRGVMDGSAYMPRHLWLEMLGENNWNEIELRDQRYDAVLHLVTAADGARDFYTLENNESRHESAEEAIGMDRRLRTSWLGHPRLRVIDNRSDFNDKMNRVISIVCNLVGLPQIPEVSRKFVVQGDFSMLGATSGFIQEFDVDQTILLVNRDGVDESVRRRGSGGVFSYVHRQRRTGSSGKVLEIKRGINEKEYLTLLQHADPHRKTLRMKRRCFLYSDQYYVLDEIKNMFPPLSLLRTQTESIGTELDLPPFVEVEEDVTNREDYSVMNLSTLVAPQRKFEYETRLLANHNFLTKGAESL
uniref:NadR/Ttd14 AAA domain-containing protein n=1 Tax=Rhodosorus marinus TaxID=101924 RepID=A0A7S3EIU0_9RHOD|mmetsp:Transcript_39337/g.156163  ORF Transcript_39337/g.156163 Transcript_39337/m.156163 type:complete len:432 (+) Transcript_39337:70-1365(+)